MCSFASWNTLGRIKRVELPKDEAASYYNVEVLEKSKFGDIDKPVAGIGLSGCKALPCAWWADG